MTTERPSSACVICPPPPEGRAWRLAPDGYRTCTACLDRLRETLKDVVARFLQLSASPGAAGDAGRGSPGYGSRPPASPHVIAFRDRRSKSCEVSWDRRVYVWDPLADTVLEPGQFGPPGGAYTQRLDVWYGRDGRPHTEQERPPRAPEQVLESLADMVAEDREIRPPRRGRPCPLAWWPHTHLEWRDGRPYPPSRPDPWITVLGRWLDNQLDYITRQEWAADVATEFRELDAQLRPVTGEPGGRRVGECPNTIDEGETTRLCKTPLYAPFRGDTIACSNPACGRKWKRPDWEKLGQLLTSTPLAS